MFVECDHIGTLLYTELRCFNSFPRLTVLEGEQVQSVRAIRECVHTYSGRKETHTLRITQPLPNEPAVITATREYFDATSVAKCERVPVWSILADRSYKTDDEQVDALIKYFRSLPRPQEWGSADDVKVVDAEEADPVLVQLIHEYFGEKITSLSE
jgi:hypothetical protein